MYTSRIPSLVALLCFVAAPLVAQADDLNPPPWRNDPLTTPHSYLAKFEVENYPGGLVGPDIEMIGPSSPYQLDPTRPTLEEVGNQGPLEYQVILPNFIDPLPIKRVRVQFSWYPGDPDPTTNPSFPGNATVQNISPMDSTGAATFAKVYESPIDIFPDPLDPQRNIAYKYEDYHIWPNPDWEIFDVAYFDGDPRWLIIDTISIPEPSTILLVGGLVGLAFVVRRRR